MAKINVETLMSEVQTHPALWQDKLKNFKNVTDKLWSEVVEKCNGSVRLMKQQGVKNNGDISKKFRSANWTQKDTDLLCDVVRSNANTNELKKADWILMAERFNSHPSVATQRDVGSIIARYKTVIRALRNYFAREKGDATQTRSVSSSVPKIEVTAAMLELQSYYDHLLSGLSSADRSSTPANVNAPNVSSNANKSDAVSTASATEPASEVIIMAPVEFADEAFSPHDSNEEWTIPRITSPRRRETITSVNSSSTPISSPIPSNTLASQQPGTIAPMLSVDEMRRQMIDEERERMAMRMQLYRDEYATRLDEIRQRKEFSAALHRKQLEFWDIAIERVKCNAIGNNLSVPDTSVQTLVNHVANVVAEFDQTSQSIQTIDRIPGDGCYLKDIDNDAIRSLEL